MTPGAREEVWVQRRRTGKKPGPRFPTAVDSIVRGIAMSFLSAVWVADYRTLSAAHSPSSYICSCSSLCLFLPRDGMLEWNRMVGDMNGSLGE